MMAVERGRSKAFAMVALTLVLHLSCGASTPSTHSTTSSTSTAIVTTVVTTVKTTLSTKMTEEAGNQTTNATVIGSNSTTVATNATDEQHYVRHGLFKSSDAVLRAVYVASGILLIIMIYVFVRIRQKNKKNKWRKYGLLHNNSEVEMVPLDREGEDEDENTMYDVRTFPKEYR